jgi:hypothetical protein
MNNYIKIGDIFKNKRMGSKRAPTKLFYEVTK